MTASPRPTSTPEPERLPLALDVWAEVVAERLNLRSAPEAAAELTGYIPAGHTGLIVGGPIESDGYVWWALAAPGLPYGSGCETSPDPLLLLCPEWFGWVASASNDGEPWLVGRTPPCGPTPTTVQELAEIPPGNRLACLGGQTLRFDALAVLSAPFICEFGYAITPEWLDPCSVHWLFPPDGWTGPFLAANLPPDMGVCGRDPSHPNDDCPYGGLAASSETGWPPTGGLVLEIQGHFDDPAAASCTAESWGLYELPAWVLDPAHIVYQCRLRFVVTGIAP